METVSPDTWQQLLQYVAASFALLTDIVAFLYRTLLPLLPLILFVVWCLWGVNWRRTWPVLAAGGWVPLVLIGGMAALTWSRIWPSRASVFGFMSVPNFLWQLGAVGLLICLGLFCGWLQGRYGWEPPEVSFEPPAHGDGHDDHGHHDHAAPGHNGHIAAH